MKCVKSMSEAGQGALAALLMTGFLAVFLTGCEPAPAVTVKNQLEPQELVEFPENEALRLTNNKLFLWKRSFAPRDVQAVLNKVDRVDELDLAGYQASGLADEADQACTAESERIKPERTPLLKRIGASKLQIRKLDTRIQQESRKPEGERDEDLLASLQEERAARDKEREELEANKTALESELKRLEQERDELRAKAQQITSELASVTEFIQCNVDWFRKSPNVIEVFFNRDGSLDINLQNWDLGMTACRQNGEAGEEVERLSSYSTADGTIPRESVKYRPLGGALEFEVMVSGNEKYLFKLARRSYGKRGVAYGGDLYRYELRFRGRDRFTGVSKYEWVRTQIGVAKLADQVGI